jgi:hypothetical protein
MGLRSTLSNLWNRLTGRGNKPGSPWNRDKPLPSGGSEEPGDRGGWVVPGSSAIAKMMWERSYGKQDRREDVGTVYLVFQKGKGKSYGYPYVPWSVWNDGLKSPSKGKWHHYVLQPGYSLNR